MPRYSVVYPDFCETSPWDQFLSTRRRVTTVPNAWRRVFVSRFSRLLMGRPTPESSVVDANNYQIYSSKISLVIKVKTMDTRLRAYRCLYWANQGLLQAVRALKELDEERA